MSPEIAARLVNLNIQTMAETKDYFMLVRELCVAMVHRTADGYSIGSTGIMTEIGLAYPVWRQERAFLAGKGGAVEAEPGQLEAIRKFSEDIRGAGLT